MAGPIAVAYIEIVPELATFTSGIKEAFSKAKTQASKAGESIEDSFNEAARQSVDEFQKIDKTAFKDAVRGADRAGEQIEDSFQEAKRTSNKALGGINLKKAATGLAALFAGAQLGSFFKDATLDAQRLNSALANTDVIITATGGVAGVTADAIRSTSQELSLLTGVAAVDIQEASNVLLTFKNIGAESFERTQAAALDMTAVLGGDAKGAAVQLGKALNDPTVGVSALSKAGVTFTDQQKEQIKTLQESGDILGAQNIVLAELEGQFKGTAEASADSTAKIGAAFTALKENVGQSLIGALDEVTPVILEVLKAITPALVLLGELLGDAFKALLPSIVALIEGLEPLFEIFGKLIPIIAPIIELIADVFVTAIEVLAEAFGPVLDALAPVVEAITGALGKALIALAPVVAKIAGIFANLLVKALDILVPIILQIAPIFSEIAVLIGGVLGQVVAQLADVFLLVFEAIAPLIPIIAEGLMMAITGLMPLVTALLDAWAEMAPLLIDALVPILPILVDLFLTLVEALLPLVPTLVLLIESLLPVFVQIIEQLTPLLENTAVIIAENLVVAVEFLTTAMTWLLEEVIIPVVDFINENFQPALTRIGEIAVEVGEFFVKMGGFFQGVYNDVLLPIKDFFVGAFKIAIEAAGVYFGALGTAFETGMGVIQTVFDDVIMPIYNFFDTTFGLAFSAAGTAVETLGEVFSTVWGGITSTVETAVEAVKTAINFIIKGWNSIEFTLPKVSVPFVGDFGGQTFGTFKIPELANGGVVRSPTLALIGENGPEVVTPLNRQRRDFLPGGNGGGAVVSISNANFYDGTDADLVAQKTVLALSARRLTA